MQLAYLEKLRADRWNECAIVLQKNIRRYIYRSRYLRIRELALKLQCVARTRIATRVLQQMRQNKAAISIQTSWRRHSARKQYLAQRRAAVKIQTGESREVHPDIMHHFASNRCNTYSVLRGYNARKQFTNLRQQNAALHIQRMARGW